MLVKAQVWIKNTFAIGSQPTLKTVRNWINKGDIKGIIINGSAWINPDDFIINKEEVIDKPKPKYRVI